MLVSIITPTWNSEKTIVETTKSIVEQDYPKIEHIIIDNLSSDNTYEELKKIYGDKKFLFISEKDKGISDAFNKGINACNGEIIGILNSDDVYLNPHVISNVVKAFNDNPSVMFVHGDMFFEDHDFGSTNRAPLMCPVTYAMPFNHPTFFVRKAFYKKYGLFDVSYRFAMDFELILRMYQSSNNINEMGIYLKELGPIVRMRAGGASYNQELKSIDEVSRALKSHNLWNLEAARAQFFRKIRVRLKSILASLKVKGLILVWRKWKWKN